jgi:hypothetical protein
MLHDGGFLRFASWDILKEDTLERNGAVAAACLSMLFRPKVIVEFGVKVGWTSLLLCRLNPKARVHGVDVSGRVYQTFLPTGYAPLMHEVKNYSLHLMNSWDFDMKGKVDLCFIDADHFNPAVTKDTWRAWENRNTEGDWCIAWDDYHPNNPDVFSTVNDFVKEVGYPLQKTMSWYWIGTKSLLESEIYGLEVPEL